MENQRQIVLDPPRTIAGREFIPVSWTFRHIVDRGDSVMVSMAREALGVILREDDDFIALMSDGRRLTVAELAVEYPSLASSLEDLK